MIRQSARRKAQAGRNTAPDQRQREPRQTAALRAKTCFGIKAGLARPLGDGRRYEWVIAIRAVQTIDFMTARWAHLPYELMETVSNRIINEISGISRVTYDISGKPPATIEWE